MVRHRLIGWCFMGLFLLAFYIFVLQAQTFLEDTDNIRTDSKGIPFDVPAPAQTMEPIQ